MPLTAYQQLVQSVPTADFTEALTSNQISANVDLVLPGRNPYWFIRAITVVSKENLDWELWLFRKAASVVGSTATFATDPFVGIWQFNALPAGPPAAPGYTVTPAAGGGANPFFHYYIDGNMLPYVDEDNPGVGEAKLHCRLVNRNASAKTAGTNGQLQVTFYVSPQGEQV